MSRSIVFALLLVTIISVHAFPHSTSCPANEEFTNCGNPCEAKCNAPPPEVCVLSCKVGCRCKSGFLRNTNGDCVMSQNC
ncbi:hypothetical protein KM043_006404 [Ampulex compressa]|uniref:Venom protein n=1 Tax=Ampulex compressa TaxID=860918 RepID=A0A1W6EW49_AMPCP|nr:venom protein [Ampulex compressa]KAG7190288.1 hypothetical protein KM043_006404 [Ampulex compressa]